MVSVERIGKYVQLGEGPHWDEDTQSLYFVDIYGGSINKYNPSTEKHTKAVIGNNVSFIIPIQGTKDKFAISVDRKFCVATWDGESEKVSKLETIAEVDVDFPQNRFNDAKLDPAGRLWAGTMGPESAPGVVAGDSGSLYSFSGSFKKQLEGIGISNGIAFNKDLGKFYYIDSLKYSVDQFDYDMEKGTISNRRPVFTFSKHNIPGLPDGQAIDTDGNLWVAVFNGSRILKIDPRKPETLLQTVEMPAIQITSVAFGGPNFDDLYVTTAKNPFEGKELRGEDGHGYCYVVKGLGAKGFPGGKLKL